MKGYRLAALLAAGLAGCSPRQVPPAEPVLVPPIRLASAGLAALLPDDAKQYLRQRMIDPSVAVGSLVPVADSLAVDATGRTATVRFRYRTEGDVYLTRTGGGWAVSDHAATGGHRLTPPADAATPAAVAQWLSTKAVLRAAVVGEQFRCPLVALAGLAIDEDEWTETAVVPESVPDQPDVTRLRITLSGYPVAVALAGALADRTFTPSAVRTLNEKSPLEYICARLAGGQ